MEYRRTRRKNGKSASMRRRQSGYTRRSSGSGTGAGGVLITLLLAAGLIYIIFSGATGDWIAQKVIEPVSALFNARNAEPSAAPGTYASNGGDEGVAQSGADIIDLSEGDSVPVSAQLTFPGISCYMLQMGVFSSLDNANNEAAALRARGAAGYILKDTSSGETRYRVMAAGYADEKSAKGVRDRLVGEGTDCTVYKLSSSSALFNVTAPESAMTGVETGFTALSNARDSLAAAVISFDKDGLSISEGRALAEDIQDTLVERMTPLSSFAPDGAALSEIFDAYSAINASLTTLCEGEFETAVDFSAAMKYTYLNITQLYAALADALAG